MSYENCSIYLIANEVAENTQKVNVSCDCNQQIEALQQEASLTKKLLLENRKLLLRVMSAIEDSPVPESKSASAVAEKAPVVT